MLATLLQDIVWNSCWQGCRHLELNGVEFPYSRGVSFYEVDDDGKITSARDIPEPTIKPGDSAIYVRGFC